MANEFRKQAIERIAADAIDWRHELHAHPQTMYEETFASDLVCRKLTEWGIPFSRGLAITGVVASVEGRRNTSGRAVAFRADMDALDINEESGQPWASRMPGKMHACGHDGHTATLLALARYLRETRNFDGTARLIFQPAEEGGRGALRMLNDGLLETFPFDEIYGFHNFPSLPRGMFSLSPGKMLAAADAFDVQLKGKGGHGGLPELANDVLPAIASLALSLPGIVSREIPPVEAASLTVTNIRGGTGNFNVISGEAALSGTVRTFREADRAHIEARIRQIADSLAQMFRAEAIVKYQRITDPVINDPVSVKYCETAAQKVSGEVKPFSPIMAGEDFGGFLNVRPGAFIILGQAESEPSSPHNFSVHHPRYDFNDRIIPVAVEYFAELAESRMPLD
jgi:amidohydrolase